MNLHAALGDLQGVPVDVRTAEEITRAALEAAATVAAILDAFCAFLGRSRATWH